MRLIERIGLACLHRLEAERAHDISLRLLKRGFFPKSEPYQSDRLRSTIAGIDLQHPIGLAAGYDKNAIAIAPLLQSGFSFLEIGAVTPRPQEGNRAPRLFRLKEDKGIINRFGFNNDGMDAIAQRLHNRPMEGIVGVNIGANRDSKNRAFDYVDVLHHLGNHVDFATINVSSPNTEHLRNLQSKDILENLIDGMLTTRDALDKPIPIFLKISPDLSDQELIKLAQVARHRRIDGIIATNTTLERPNLKSQHPIEKGGLSGCPLFEKSTHVLAVLAHELQGTIPLIGVGGISNAQDAFVKITAGASALQLYTAMIYQGLSVVNDIARDLDELLAKNGFEHINQAIGARTNEHL